MLVSLIIPVYNHYNKLPKLFESLENQTFKDFECVIVDDGSKEIPKNFEVELKKLHFKTLFLKRKHEDAGAARNAGATMASGNFLLFTDADIIFKPCALEMFVNTLIKNPQVTFAYSEYKFGFKKMRGIDFDFATLKKMNYIHTTSILRKDFFPGFDETLKKFQDWDLWLGICENGGVGKLIPQLLYIVRQRGGIKSFWMPSWAYKWPFKHLLSDFDPMIAYQQGRAIIAKKHGLKYE